MKGKNKPDSGFSRRELGARAAWSAAAAAILKTKAVAQGRGGAQVPPADQAEVDAKLADVVRRYGDRLSDQQKTRVRGALSNHQRMLSRIRAFPIENGDAPATGLRLYPNDTAVPKPAPATKPAAAPKKG